MTTRIAYKSLDLIGETRVFKGRGKTKDVCTVNGVTITRVIDGQLDYFAIAGPNVVDDLEILPTNVAGSVRIKDAPVLKGKGGKATAEAAE
jgi:hypothetical protein